MLGYEDKVAAVDNQPQGLADYEDRVPAVQGVEKEYCASAEREIPECDRDDAFLFPLRRYPLYKKPHKKKKLPEKADYQPEFHFYLRQPRG